MDAYGLVHMMPKNREKKPPFPATMPDNIDEKKMHEVAAQVAQEQDKLIPDSEKTWFIGPKADGQRFLYAAISLIRSARVFHVVINRKWDMWLLNIKTPKGLTERTIIDFELMDTENVYHWRAIDIICTYGLDVRNYRLTDRQVLLQETLKNISSQEKFPMKFSIKRFLPLTVDNLIKVVQMIANHPEDYEGLIFMQNTWSIVAGTDFQGLFKFKECELQTCDVYMQLSEDKKMCTLFYTEDGTTPVVLAEQTPESIMVRNSVAKDKTLTIDQIDKKVGEYTVEKKMNGDKKVYIYRAVKDRSHEKDRPNIGGVIRRIHQALDEELNFEKTIHIFEMYTKKKNEGRV
jgi:hypothetical protein